MKILLAGLLLVSMAAPKPKTNGFMGHYGYLMLYPLAYAPEPSFEGPIEAVQFMPKKGCPPDELKKCAKSGWINLAVTPKWLVKEANAIGSFKEYMNAVMSESKGAGEKPVGKEGKAGKLPAYYIRLAKPRGPFDAMAYADGAKVYYRIAYDSSNPHAVKMLAGLAEIQPHDQPPAR
jgi:hypothetical protein